MSRRKSLFVRHYEYICDENSNGKPSKPRLPTTIFLAAACCESKGHDVSVLSVVDEPDFDVRNHDTVVAWVPLYEGFDLHVDYLRRAKEYSKRTVMILNEPLATFEREALETYPFIDVVIRQEEREYVLEQVLSELEKDIRCREFEFPGVIYRDAAGEIKDNGQCPPFKNLHHLVSSSKFLLKEKEKAVFSHYDQAFVEVGRGCPYQCDFCFYNNTRYRTRGIEDIIDELKVIEGHFTHIWLHDLNMLVHKKFTRQLCEAIIENNVKVRWGTDVRLELLNDPDLLQLMNKAGCYLLVAGFESGDENVLKNIHKGKNFDYLDMGLKYCQMADITLSLNLMIGFPWEDDEALRKTERFAQEYYIGFIQYVRPLRGTPLYDKYKHLGLIDRDLTIEDYKNLRYEPMFPTLSLTKDEIAAWMKKLARACAKRGQIRPGMVKELSQLPQNANVALYGAGSAGSSFRQLLEEQRPDVRVRFFIDSFREGKRDNLDILKWEIPDKYRNEIDSILITSSGWEEIEKNLVVSGMLDYKIVSSELFKTYERV